MEEAERVGETKRQSSCHTPYRRKRKRKRNNDEETGLKKELPENWIDLDAVLLRGAYGRIIEQVRKQFGDATMPVIHESRIEVGLIIS